MKILLLGKRGQVGWELQRALQPLGEIIALDRSVNDTGLSGDIGDFLAISKVMDGIKPNIVVNATAYTAVDKAESEVDQANHINHIAVKNLAELCKQHNALLIHYSTDYVFNGEGVEGWSEDDHAAPINVYGQTKRDGEIALEQSQVDFINFRTSWVYGAQGNNFIKTMLKLGQIKDELNIIHDQVGAPTGAALIADVTAQVIRLYSLTNDEEKIGLIGHYHLASAGTCSWFEYAQYIFKTARILGQDLKVNLVNPINTVEYPTPAKRPLNSRLNTQKLQQTFKIHLPHWKQGVEQVLQEIIK
ncbi:dTDP-4-dehydrorhamnose reductase [Acinetobacter sp. TGL-Y2]|uniref:dTDP-4-dehydrorhamnose reductase n=1 Tax=Acinetobacter sp. TGL-Y2 TaxID=1407071 RepID=UPI0007A66600|nr:dTDP-4-dehydrorhamnose reductase [Acinetobacter sp. TGL-Y2]AMW77513.1 dTDP-4-dehydrorhamnose reductase [Acinetobacter sp. TGL-Y2]